MVVWENFLQNAADLLGLTVEQTGVFLSLIFTMSFLLIVALATRGRGLEMTMPTISIFMVLLFTYFGWLPTWVGATIALIIAILAAYQWSKVAGGG